MTPFCQRPLQVMSLSRYNSANHDLCISLEYLQGEFMLALLKTYTMVGLEARPVDVEVDTVCDPNTPAPAPSITTVGLPDKAVRECGQRVKRAIAVLKLEYTLGSSSCWADMRFFSEMVWQMSVTEMSLEN